MRPDAHAANVQRPEGLVPRSTETCPLCKAAPNVAHKPKCPWRLWAEDWPSRV